MTTNINTSESVTDVAVRNAKTDETGIYFHYFFYGAKAPVASIQTRSTVCSPVSAPHPILTFYENQLILAEANARLDNFSDALDALNGVRDVLATGYVNGLETGYGTIGSS